MGRRSETPSFECRAASGSPSGRARLGNALRVPVGDISQAQTGVPQAFDDPDRPHAITQRGPPGQEVAYGYDPNGNVTSITGPGGSQFLSFDSASRLACIGYSPGTGSVISLPWDRETLE